jgi:hypothetical protein
MSLYLRRLVLFLLLVPALLLGCDRAAPPQAVVAIKLLELIFEFATATLPIKKIGRMAGVISISSGKAAIKVESEIAKSGIKIGAQLPVLDFKSIARAAYQAQYGRDPSAEFNQNSDAAFLIVESGSEHHVFVVDSSYFCVANIEDPKLYQISFQERYVKVSVSDSETDVKFGTTTDACKAISAEISERQARKQEDALKHAYTLLEIEEAVVRADGTTGEVVVRLVRNGRETEMTFRPQDFISKNGIQDRPMLAKFIKNVKPTIESCTVAALSSSAADYVALLEARSRCLTEGGFNANDQVYFEVRKLYDT